MRGDRSFFDTNILIYAFRDDDSRKIVARDLLAEGGVVSVQTLNEFVSVATAKLRMPWREVLESLDAIRFLCPKIVPITVETHDRALRIVAQHHFHIYDSLMLAAAIEAGCFTFYSEDLQDGQVIDGLTIRNPFREF